MVPAFKTGNAAFLAGSSPRHVDSGERSSRAAFGVAAPSAGGYQP
jgi:hypothetical protein